MKTTLFALCIFSLPFSLFAQNDFHIIGQILDKETKEGIGFAHIGLPELGLGTTSAEDGSFEFKIPSGYDDSEMMISFMGYKTYRKAIRAVRNPMTIYLEQDNINLMEVVVMDENRIEDIVRKAVNNIPKNYPTHPTTHLGFYRESKTNDSLQYLYMAEGVLNIYKHSYKSKNEGMVSLVQGRRINLLNPLDTNITAGLGSGHMAGHRFDIVQNREDFLREKFFPFYKYWIESITSYNGRPVYIIGFGENEEVDMDVVRENGWEYDKDSGQKVAIGGFKIAVGKDKVKTSARMKGRLYIEKETYAIIRTEFEITKNGLKKYSDYPLYTGNWSSNKYVVNYRPLGKKWYFSDALREGVIGGGVYTNEIKITQINPKKSNPLPYKDRLYPSHRFSKMTGSYNSDFWKGFNTTPLSGKLSESVQQLENAKKAQEAFDHEYMMALQEQRDSIQRVRELEELEQRKAGLELEGEKIDMSTLIQEIRPKPEFTRFKASIGAGVHQIPTVTRQMQVIYLNDEEPSETILSIDDSFEGREYEIIADLTADFFFKKNFFIRAETAFDFYNSIYKERSIGVGTEWNLNRQRPFYFKAAAQIGRLRYARQLGVVENTYGKFKARGKKFNSDEIRVFYGSRVYTTKLSAEFAIELNPHQELYVRGTYHIPIHQRADIWLKEKGQFSNKKRWIPVKRDEVFVETNDFEGLSSNLVNDNTISLTVGLSFK